MIVKIEREENIYERSRWLMSYTTVQIQVPEAMEPYITNESADLDKDIKMFQKLGLSGVTV